MELINHNAGRWYHTRDTFNLCPPRLGAGFFQIVNFGADVIYTAIFSPFFFVGTAQRECNLNLIIKRPLSGDIHCLHRGHVSFQTTFTLYKIHIVGLSYLLENLIKEHSNYLITIAMLF